MGESYSPKDMITSVLAITADELAYRRARKDYEKGKISKESLQDFTFISHRYLPDAKRYLSGILEGSISPAKDEGEKALEVRQSLKTSAGAEIDAMVNALNGIPVRPAPVEIRS